MRDRRAKALGGLVIVLALCGAIAPSAEAADGERISRTVLRGTPHLPEASGTAEFVLYPRHAEIDLRVHGLPRERHPVYLLWLDDAMGHTRMAGGFPRTRATGFAGSAITVGPLRQTRAALRSCKRLVITAVSRPRLPQLIRKARSSHFRDSMKIAGVPVLKGRPEELAGILGK